MLILVENKNIKDINNEIEKELLKYQSQLKDSSESSSFSWPKAIAYIVIILMFILPILINIFMS